MPAIPGIGPILFRPPNSLVPTYDPGPSAPAQPTVKIWPRGGFDTSNYWTSSCPICNRVHKLYSASGYVCTAAGSSPGYAVLVAVQYGVDITAGDPTSALLIGQSLVVES